MPLVPLPQVRPGARTMLVRLPLADDSRMTARAIVALFLFTWAGRPIQGTTVSARMSRLLAPHTCHSLRHAFATELYESTGDIALVSRMLGHASVQTTQRYVLIRDDRAARAVAGLKLAA